MHSPLSHTSRTSKLRCALLIGALAAAATACSSDKAASSPSASGSATTSSPGTAVKSTTTSASASTTVITTSTTSTTGASTDTTTAPGSTTTVPGVPVYPLTGVPVDDPASAARPALVVKIDNAPDARPQSGFNEADIVIEEIVNDNLTRFAMIFQSGGSDPVGPIRSGRIQDIDLFTALNHPLFAWSGGNKTVTDRIDASELINIGPAMANLYFRTNDKQAPHNLYSTTERLYTEAVPGSTPVPQQFQYRAAGTAPGGVPSPGLGLGLDSINVNWDWDAASGLYRRKMGGREHDDANSGQVTTNNVVVLAMDYVPGISDSPDAQTIGTGEAFVLSGGNYVHGTWERDDAHKPFSLKADDGTLILLQPGRTFIELPRVGHTLVTPG